MEGRLARKCVIWRRRDEPVVLELADDVALDAVRACRDVIVLSDTSQSPASDRRMRRPAALAKGRVGVLELGPRPLV